ncbi:uncharacterized protein EV420DRAFT_1644521 [Desarmillaria tabescens]|uniref:Methyltransferase n=1 Tax=Armillaria tabescens TaxID=1929756 RepID=A0AA39K9J2_ARMTA|nr:uncharacterized protein EV420DRAFT_1644521 [Desarmillaria tabescens]KAK0455739.1 hypothetical protein EV420DRAFT_1644521 [Desarmillaria tabescens]
MSSGVVADLFFMQSPANGERAYIKNNAGPDARNNRNYILEPKTVTVENYRTKLNSESITLDTAGFQLFSNRPTQFIKDGEVQVEGYYDESIALLKELTGASKVVIFDHTIRRRRPGESGDNPDKRQPAAIAHVDQTFKATIARVHRHLPPEDAPGLLAKRFQIINLWRPIENPATDWPLALCHFSSVDPEKDVEPIDLIYPDRKGETYGVKYNEHQRWGYFKDMRDPMSLFSLNGFNESVQDGSVALYTPHTAFADPTTPEGTPFRQSIEIRALVFYD